MSRAIMLKEEKKRSQSHPSLLDTDKGTISSLRPSALGSAVRRAGGRLFVSCPPDVACPQRGRPPFSLCLSALTVT